MYYCVFPRNIHATSDIMKHIITTFVIETSVDSTSALPETVTNLVIKSSISEGRLNKCSGYFGQMFSKCTQKSYMILDRFISWSYKIKNILININVNHIKTNIKAMVII